MSYIKTNWINDETELSAENFNHMEEGISNAYPFNLIAISDIAPSGKNGDKYYNSTDNKIYTYNDGWNDPEEPKENTFYVILSENANYCYDGEKLVAVGGGKEPVIISNEEPLTNDWKLWIDTGEVDGSFSEVVDSLDGNETTLAPSVRAVNKANTYSTEETFTGKYWIDGKKIYRKVVDIGALPNATTKSIRHNINNIKNVTKIEGLFYKENFFAPMPASDTLYLDYQVKIYIDNININVSAGTDRSDCNGFAIIEYTKTTD